MKQLKAVLYNLNPFVLSIIWSIFMIAQITSSFFLHNPDAIEVLRYIANVVWPISAIFGIWPIIIFRRKGGVPEGKNYMHTTVVVDSGPYAIVRHPQYLAGILVNLALMLLIQHWLIVVLGIVPMLLTYLDAIKADWYCIEKFGEDYEHYMQRVPRLNFLAGLVRLVLHSLGGNKNEAANS